MRRAPTAGRAVSLALLVAVLGGCAPVLYAPNSHLAPVFEEPGEVHAWGRFGLGNPMAFPGFDGELQGAFSPLDHLSVFASTAVARRRGLRYHLGEAGAGTYVRLGGGLRAELLAGHGRGRIEAKGIVRDTQPIVFFPFNLYFPGDSYEAAADYSRSFVQLNVGLRPDAKSVVGVAVKASRVRFSGISVDGRPAAEARGLYAEPALFARIGNGILSLEKQFGYVVPLRRSGMEHFESRRFYLSVGIHARIEQLFGRRAR